MRLALQLNCAPNSLLPLNYQYLISSWIYKVLSSADPGFANWLHERGYDATGKQFKLFTFSRIDLVPPFRIDQKNAAIYIQSGKIRLTISFFVAQAVQHFVMGLFKRSTMSLGNRQFRAVDFSIEAIEMLPKIMFQPTMRYRAITSICISRKEDGAKQAQYQSPDYSDYETLFVNNLLQKFTALMLQRSLVAGTKIHQNTPIKFQALSLPQPRLIHIKSGSPQATKVRGYHFDFALTAAIEIQELGYYAGFGEKNPQGFGYVEIII